MIKETRPSCHEIPCSDCMERQRSMTANDKDIYLRIQAEEDVVADFYQKYPETLIANMSRTLNNPDEHSIVTFQQPNDQFIAICSFQGLQKDTIEIGYTVVKELRGKGIGTRMVREFIQIAHSCFPDREIYARVRTETSVIFFTLFLTYQS